MGGLDPPIQHHNEGIDCSLDGRIKCGHDDKRSAAMTNCGYLILNLFFTASRPRKMRTALIGNCSGVSTKVTLAGLCGCSAVPV